MVLIGFNLGNRTGETRVLTFDCISEKDNTIKILHFIEYNPKSNDYLKSTKNYQSQIIVDVTDKLINIIK